MWSQAQSDLAGVSEERLFDLLFRRTNTVPLSKKILLAIAFWHIWEARNERRNGETDLHPWCWVERIIAYGDMVMLHYYQSFTSNRCESTSPNHWTPPPEGWIMVNVDAAIFERENRMGLGLVVRNHNGDFLAALTQGIDKITNPEMAETIAFRRAVRFAMQLPYNQVLIATDCLSLVNKLLVSGVDRSHTGMFIEDIKQESRASSVVFSFIHVTRNCNQVAHLLARSVVQLDESVWFEVPPDFIVTKLCNDRLN